MGQQATHPTLVTCALRVHMASGGEGSTAREVLRHKSVERCVMVDIDEVPTGLPRTPIHLTVCLHLC